MRTKSKNHHHVCSLWSNKLRSERVIKSKRYENGNTAITKWATLGGSWYFNLWSLCLMRLSPSSLWKNEHKTSTSSIGSIRNIFTATISLWLHQPRRKGKAAGSLSRYSTGLSPTALLQVSWLSQALHAAFFKHLPPSPALAHFFKAIPGRKAMKALLFVVSIGEILVQSEAHTFVNLNVNFRHKKWTHW